jgi:hypothetical protein
VHGLPKGKGKGRADIRVDLEEWAAQAGPELPKDICQFMGLPILVCFCCPMPSIKDYQKLYVGPDYLSSNAHKSFLGKDIIEMHLEFMAHKVAGEAMIRKGQNEHGHLFHSDEELIKLVTWTLGTTAAHLHYGPPMIHQRVVVGKLGRGSSQHFARGWQL